MTTSSRVNHVLIVGGGFGGTRAALTLAGSGTCRVTLVSDHSHFRYYPGLYHTATGGRRAGTHIPLKNILRGTNVTFIRATAKQLDQANKELLLTNGKTVSYDQIILGLGNVTNYFGIPGLPEYSYGIKSIEEAERFKQHLHEQLAEDGRPDLNYVIVGGGPTGIELAGALPGYLRQVMRKHGLRERTLHITLIEAAPRLLPRMPKDISAAISRRLKKLGITIMLGTAVKGETADTLMAGDKPIKTETVIWTAGVANNPFFKENGFALTDRGKVEVDEYLQAAQDVFVIGDNANTPYSGLAQTALHDATFVAHNIIRSLGGKMPESYKPKEPISVIPVGKNWASVQWGRKHFNGYAGWVLRLLADLVAFHHLESWPKAGEQWMQSAREDDWNCPSCTQ